MKNMNVVSNECLASEKPVEWMSDGLCRRYPPETFFPADRAGVCDAQQICAECPVSDACLEYALAHHIDHGIWGGMSERGRKRLLGQRNITRLLQAV
jgi:WhiB family transcriptional regulator, redox-sensing transcriptional regulator